MQPSRAKWRASLAHGGRLAFSHAPARDLWPRWLEMAGADQVDANGGPGFSDSSLVLQAAVDGHGVALGRVFLAADDIAAQRLVKPFTLDLPNDYSYWLVYPKSSAAKLRVEAFRDWLLEETKAFRED
jgi:LysR family transcriptional regulator, glycine cleavage system transcriptional activator